MSCALSQSPDPTPVKPVTSPLSLGAGEEGKRAVRSQKRLGVRAQFVQEVADYIVAQGGPDAEGRAHPTVARINALVLEDALAIAARCGVSTAIRPYHFRGQTGAWNNPRFVDEAMVKKFDRVLIDLFNGDLFRLMTEATREDLLSPFVDTSAGRPLEIVLGSMGRQFAGSPLAMLRRYREIKGITNFSDLRPYHRSMAPLRTFDDPLVVDEVLIKKVEQVLRTKFNGDLFRLMTESTQEDLLSPLNDMVAGRSIQVSMDSVGGKFKHSPVAMLARYRELKKITEFSDLRPYHMQSQAPKGTYDDPIVVNEVVIKKIDRVLENNFRGDLFKLMTEATVDDLFSPLIDVVAGRPVEVSMRGVRAIFNSSPFPMLAHYRSIKGITGFSDLKPYHMQTSTSRGVFDDPAVVDEVLVKKIDQVLRNTFDGDVFRLMIEATKEDLTSPLIDTVGERSVEVSMGLVGKKFQSSPLAMLERYRTLKGLSEFADLKPYHRKIAPHATFHDATVVDELLVKKVDQVVKEKFDGDLFRLMTEVTLDDLLSPLADAVGGRSIEVSMGAVGLNFGNSRTAMLERFRVVKNIEEYSDLRRYHMQSNVAKGTFDDPSMVDEVVVKKIDRLLKEKFKGDLFKLMTEATIDDLVAPLVDTVADRALEVSMGVVVRKFGTSPFSMYDRYCKLKNLPFSASRLCFVGSPETRARRLRGEFNDYDRALIRTEDGSFDTRKFGMRAFNSIDKKAVRELLVEVAIGVLGENQVWYLGLEDQHMESLRTMYQFLNLAPGASAVIERDPRTYAAMLSLRGALPNGEGESLSRVTMVNDTLEHGLSRLTGPFNFVNLDYVGHFAPAHLRTCQELMKGKLCDASVLAFTHQDTALARKRTENLGLGSRGARELPGRLITQADDEWIVTPVGELPYSGGTGRQSTPMITQVFVMQRKSAPVSE